MDSNEPLRSLSRRQERNLLKAAASVAGSEFESPSRESCPDHRTLRLLASRDPSVEESPELIDHIGTCSPCFLEYSRYRSRHKLCIRLYYAIPSIFLVAGLAAWSLGALSPRAPMRIEQAAAPPNAPEPVPELSMTLDLRTRAVPRGEDRSSRALPPLPQLKRARLVISIQLPVGSEDGHYEASLIDAAGNVRASAKGTATLQRFIEILPIQLDLTELSAGTYTLRLRRDQAPWRDFGVRLE